MSKTAALLSKAVGSRVARLPELKSISHVALS
jgi:hypothetical protein